MYRVLINKGLIHFSEKFLEYHVFCTILATMGVSFLNNINSLVFFCEVGNEFLFIAYANFDTCCWHFVILNVTHSYLPILVAVRPKA